MNKLDVLARINPQMKAILAKEATLAGDANDTSVGFDVMRENYVLGREFWVEGGPVMKLSFDEELIGPHGPMAVRFYYPTDEALAGKEAQSPPLRLSSTCTEAASFSATLTLMIASAASSPAIQARSSWQSITASSPKRNSLQPWRRSPSLRSSCTKKVQPMASIPSAWGSQAIQVVRI